ncbi:MAG: formate dehydrogenase subunit gamma [Alphaproteobacteria bacterium]
MSNTTWIARAATIMLLCAVAFIFATGETYASSHVRPPGNAVNVIADDGAPNTLGDQSDAEIWDIFRGGDPRDILATKPEGAVMTTTGQQWRVIRERVIVKYAGWFPVGVIAILTLYFLVKGKVPIEGGRSGKMIPRFTLVHRIAHWYTAVVFMILGLSGLIILLGRPVIVPLLGHEVNSTLTSAALQGHNLFGPLFIIALIWMFVKFVRKNFFQIVDFKWIFKLGGLLGGHVSSSQFNFGEKSWFWMLMILGAVMSITGLALEFPWFIEDLRLLQLSTILHGIGAITLISVSIGHIYMGTLGVEGAIDGMLIGEVDENWAKEHHDLWYEEVTGKSAKDEGDVT